ncbi:MAG TPA: MBL fold metallo-hydrolase [Vicinamibacterales bacterium]|nr:MBL fold metallo-hydrolase [Vicinamibacterales bacterium]
MRREIEAVSRRRFIGTVLGSVVTAAAATARADQPRSRLILLGTAGGPTPKPSRAAPANAIVIGDRTYVIDCGNGVARQLALAHIPLTTIRHVFITHHHSDHDADYGNLLLLAWGDRLTTRVDTWGPPPLRRMTKLFLEMNQPDITVRERDEGRPPLGPLIHPHEVDGDGDVMRDDVVRVTAARVEHPLVPVALAYRFDCPDRSIVFSGDTRRSDHLVALARGADVLVHEVLLPSRLPGNMSEALRLHIMNSHTAAEDAGRVAAAAGVKMLVLTHLVPTEPPAPDDEWMAPARRHFTGRIVVARDLLEL